MHARPIIAIVSVCAAAGVVTYDVKYFSSSAKPAVVAATPTSSGDSPSATSSPASGASDGATSSSGASVRTDATPSAPKRDLDLKQLFDQLAARDAERAAQRAGDEGKHGAADADLMEALQDRATASASSTAWDRLELRGTLVGGERALALVNGRLLAVGDELPGVRFRIERILADRVITVAAPGAPSRALTLHKFESPNKKISVDLNAPRAMTPVSSADNNTGSTGGATNATPAGGKSAGAAPKGDKQ